MQATAAWWLSKSSSCKLAMSSWSESWSASVTILGPSVCLCSPCPLAERAPEERAYAPSREADLECPPARPTTVDALTVLRASAAECWVVVVVGLAPRLPNPRMSVALPACAIPVVSVPAVAGTDRAPEISSGEK